MNYLVEYFNKINIGEIVLGKDLYQVLEGLIKDLDNPRYIFDEKAGNIRIDFIETYCKHTKSPFNGQPFILELWEKAVLQAATDLKWLIQIYEDLMNYYYLLPERMERQHLLLVLI